MLPRQHRVAFISCHAALVLTASHLFMDLLLGYPSASIAIMLGLAALPLLLLPRAQRDGDSYRRITYVLSCVVAALAPYLAVAFWIAAYVSRWPSRPM